MRFESAHHSATVFVDGTAVRRHVGAYEPFTARVRLAPGRHTIAVRVDWRAPRRQADAGWARGWFNYGGLNRPVTLMRLGPSELGALTVRTRLDAARRRARVDIAVRVRNRAAPRSIRLRGTISRGGQAIRTLDFGVARVGRHTSRALRASATIDDPSLWSPRSPALYDLRIDAPGEATLRRRIGLREIAWGGGGLRLNGRPLVLRGAGLPPDARGRGDALRAVGRSAHRRGAARGRRQRDPLAAAAVGEHARAPGCCGDPHLAGDRAVGAGRALARAVPEADRGGVRSRAAGRRGRAGEPVDPRVDADQRGRA